MTPAMRLERCDERGLRPRSPKGHAAPEAARQRMPAPAVHPIARAIGVGLAASRSCTACPRPSCRPCRSRASAAVEHPDIDGIIRSEACLPLAKVWNSTPGRVFVLASAE